MATSLHGQVTRRLTNYSSGKSVAYRLRQKRIVPLMRMLDAVSANQSQVRVLDLGGTDHYWRLVPEDFLRKRNVHVTVANLTRMARANDDLFTFVEADGCTLSYDDNSFDVCHSNSVIEHVGDWARMKAFAQHVSRVAPRYFVQTPNFWFPVEPHCMTPLIHWIPKPWRVWLLTHFALGHWDKKESVDAAMQSLDRVRLLDRGMMQALFPDARILTERVALLPKSLTAMRE